MDFPYLPPPFSASLKEPRRPVFSAALNALTLSSVQEAVVPSQSQWEAEGSAGSGLTGLVLSACRSCSLRLPWSTAPKTEQPRCLGSFSNHLLRLPRFRTEWHFHQQLRDCCPGICLWPFWVCTRHLRQAASILLYSGYQMKPQDPHDQPWLLDYC